MRYGETTPEIEEEMQEVRSHALALGKHIQELKDNRGIDMFDEIIEYLKDKKE